ncbi:MAG: hypothetical protein RL220_1460 [Bacteroidota bacterium]|jgi:hypothetical protein
MHPDKFDFVLMDIIHYHKKNSKGTHIRLSDLESTFWTRIQHDVSNHQSSLNLGERITQLYLEGFILFRNGYALTRKGKESLSSFVREAERL